MQYYRCKCGSYEAWGSMPPRQCAWCDKCQSNPAQGPSGHREKIEHEFVATAVETDAGEATLSRCRFCTRTKAQVEEEVQRKSAAVFLRPECVFHYCPDKSLCQARCIHPKE